MHSQSDELSLTLGRLSLESGGSNSTQGPSTGTPFDTLGVIAGSDLTPTGVVDSHVVQWTSNPHAWANTTSVLYAGVTSITLVDPVAGEPVDVNNTSSAMVSASRLALKSRGAWKLGTLWNGWGAALCLLLHCARANRVAALRGMRSWC